MEGWIWFWRADEIIIIGITQNNIFKFNILNNIRLISSSMTNSQYSIECKQFY